MSPRVFLFVSLRATPTLAYSLPRVPSATGIGRRGKGTVPVLCARQTNPLIAVCTHRTIAIAARGEEMR